MNGYLTQCSREAHPPMEDLLTNQVIDGASFHKCKLMKYSSLLCFLCLLDVAFSLNNKKNEKLHFTH